MKLRFLFLFFLCFSLFAQILPLKGNRYDYLVDFDKKKVFCGVEEFDFDSDKKCGYFFVWDKSLFLFEKGKVINLNEKKESGEIKNSLLPDADYLPYSIQDLVKGNLLFIPIKTGFAVFDLKKGEIKGSLSCVFDKTERDIVLPEVKTGNDRIFLVFNKRVEVFNDFEKEKTLHIDNALFFTVSAGKDFFSILSVEKPGGLFSIKTVLKSYDYKFNLLNKKEIDVFPKNIYEINGNFVFEKKEISVFSLFGSKKIHIVRTDLKNGKIKEYSFSLSHKRRHVFPLYYGKKIFLIAQCKDGKVYLLDLYRDKKRKTDKKVYYDYDFLKGKKGGVFYEENGNNYFPVKFELSLISRIF
ncbi:hypothetical protein TTHT_1988 [Thermotomaculum hydrothermale]|uniref:Uncharacterized protein n=1 Tax=Thermotomaculum hydrothermale TaxID=981385 RepID=A0A7R6PSA3_9BACT|nr:hypothetical protein [Thermotomaculum hydrothermale]BBB33431.1 hypothetical protein TTHT_1988 [Thermotomaculum hydrothermale]